MDRDFWLERWQGNQIAFHQPQVNDALARYWPLLDLPADSQVLVPLCGKTLDMHWLHQQGHRVLGVELSGKAVRDFFAEAGLRPEQSALGPFACSQVPGLALWAGDIFALEHDHVQQVAAVFDRAALVALPPEMRARYVGHLGQVLPARVQQLLLTLEYVEGSKSGPPHHVAADEVQALYGAAGFAVQRLASGEAFPAPPPMQEQGLLKMREVVWHLRRQPAADAGVGQPL